MMSCLIASCRQMRWCEEQQINYVICNLSPLLLVVAPVVPDLDSDVDTTNFDDIADPEGGEETFAVTKVRLWDHLIWEKLGSDLRCIRKIRCI